MSGLPKARIIWSTPGSGKNSSRTKIVEDDTWATSYNLMTQDGSTVEIKAGDKTYNLNARPGDGDEAIKPPPKNDIDYLLGKYR